MQSRAGETHKGFHGSMGCGGRSEAPPRRESSPYPRRRRDSYRWPPQAEGTLDHRTHNTPQRQTGRAGRFVIAHTDSSDQLDGYGTHTPILDITHQLSISVRSCTWVWLLHGLRPLVRPVPGVERP